jgi:peptidoglycan hydrolase-like protein with peptidoglycan-binding domain
MVSGKGEGAKPSKIKRKSDVSAFSKSDKNVNKETVKTFQQRLIDLGKLPTGKLNGEFDEETKNASKEAMTYLGTISGKVYADNEEAFQDFQRDLGFYTDNKDEIKKKMGL